MTTAAPISCIALIQAAFAKWPDVFPSDAMSLIISKVNETASDPSKQLYAARHLLLEWAARQCSECKECSLANNRLCGPVWADGSVSAKVFVIGEGPGQYDQRSCTPFTHSRELQNSWCQLRCENFQTCYPMDALKNGTRLLECAKSRAALSDDVTAKKALNKFPPIHTPSLDAAIDGLFERESWGVSQKLLGSDALPSELYITNLVKCRSIDKNGDDFTPAVSYVRSCKRWMEIQLTIIQPEVVILLGKQAGADMLGKPRDSYKVTECDGVFGPRTEAPALPDSVRYIGTALHPAYIKRQYDKSKAAGDAASAGIRRIFEEARRAIGETR